MEDTTMVIEERACPRCGNLRTVRLRRELSMCWNCKLQWSPIPVSSDGGAIVAPADVVPETEHTSQLDYPFTPRELQRLAHYRAAVIAGFYTDALLSHTPATAIRGKG
jgi:hypothetical protein